MLFSLEYFTNKIILSIIIIYDNTLDKKTLEVLIDKIINVIFIYTLIF